ncbi:MAG: SH3 domain-containing protein [Lachnospiraceae bacterium]|nr:SH3 domain-containing protein [Lachnospiraceae bacterium]
MRKRIGMAAIVCCFGMIMYLCAANADKVASEQDTGINKVKIEAEEIISNVQIQETQVQTTEESSQDEESEYVNLAIADVTDYVNVRTEPNTDSEIVGKIYDGAVAQILSVAGEQDDWFQIVSGNVEGYIKAEFFLYGDAAAEVIDEYVIRYAKIQADRLNVRENPSTDAERIGYIDNGEKVKILENLGDWLKVEYTEGKNGYVAAEYVAIAEEFVYAWTLEEEQAEMDARKTLEERMKAQESEVPEILGQIEFPSTRYTSNEELRKAIVDYALQYIGNKYVHGGSGLASGTDCSGFTCFVYADFGYSISRTPSGQYSGAGRSISYSEIQPGDIICYSTNGGKSCTHVGLYIGDGQIVHSANSRKGVIISAADYSSIIGIRNVID